MSDYYMGWHEQNYKKREASTVSNWIASYGVDSETSKWTRVGLKQQPTTYDLLRDEIVRAAKAEEGNANYGKWFENAKERGMRAVKTLLKLESILEDLQALKKRDRSMEEEAAHAVEHALGSWDSDWVEKMRKARDDQ